MDAEQEVITLTQGVEGVTDDIIKTWAQRDIETLKNESRKPAISSSEEYALKLSVLYSARSAETDASDQSRSEDESDICRLEAKYGFKRQDWGPESDQYLGKVALAAEKQRQSLLQKIRQEALDRKYLINSLRKYGIGQAISSRLGKQIKKYSKKISTDIDAYNKLGCCPSTGCLPTLLSFDQASDPEQVLSFLQAPMEEMDAISACLKRQVVAAFSKRERCIEEEHLIVQDLQSE